MIFGNRYGINFKNDINKTRILKVLQRHDNKEVNAWKLSYDAKVLHYTQAIMELRAKGYIIENRLEHKGRVMHSFYKLITQEIE